MPNSRIDINGGNFEGTRFFITDANMPLLVATLKMLQTGTDAVPTKEFLKEYTPFMLRSWEKTINSVYDAIFP